MRALGGCGAGGKDDRIRDLRRLHYVRVSARPPRGPVAHGELRLLTPPEQHMMPTLTSRLRSRRPATGQNRSARTCWRINPPRPRSPQPRHRRLPPSSRAAAANRKLLFMLLQFISASYSSNRRAHPAVRGSSLPLGGAEPAAQRHAVLGLVACVARDKHSLAAGSLLRRTARAAALRAVPRCRCSPRTQAPPPTRSPAAWSVYKYAFCKHPAWQKTPE